MRSGNPDSYQNDAMRNFTGTITAMAAGVPTNSLKGSGAFAHSETGTGRPTGDTGSYNAWRSVVTLDPSTVVPTASENRPVNVGMTPAIYLGV